MSLGQGRRWVGDDDAGLAPHMNEWQRVTTRLGWEVVGEQLAEERVDDGVETLLGEP